MKHPTIPRILLPQGKLCSLEELELQRDKPTEQSHDKREMYAKMALLMFYPFQELNKLTCDGSYWKLFYRELHHHLKNETTKFWKKRFQYTSKYRRRIYSSKTPQKSKGSNCHVNN